MEDKDIKILKARGITEELVNEQLERFKTGYPFLKIASSATVGNGIVKLSDEQENAAVARWERFLADGGSVTKFVPASGAASRMFKSLYAFVNGSEEVPTEGSDVDRLLRNLDRLPFIDELDAVLTGTHNKTAAQLKAEGRNKDIIRAIIEASGMNYGNLPKGLLTFHRYDSDKGVRTPLEEQMVEGAQTAATGNTVNLHFTVSGNHRKLFENKIAEVLPTLEEEYGVKFNIGLSEQKASTDTIAVNPDNSIFRDEEGNPVFRPGGHGALIENLGDIDTEVVFIKNIDNVVPDSKRGDTIRYKKILGGVLILAHDTIGRYLKELEGEVTSERLNEMLDFVETELCIHAPEKYDDQVKLKEYLRGKLNRPLRVCGMVVNEGEPGGGPYLAYNNDGTFSPQILESTQIDKTNTQALETMNRATHFNPVDLVCYLRDAEGNKFPLRNYVDTDTGFISEKSLGGRDLKALELPGLWNGAMSDWSTIFVEVPMSTFNPVKTVNDLLRPMHEA